MNIKRYAVILSLSALAVVGVLFAPHATKSVHGQQYAKCVSALASPACQSASYGIATIAAGAQTVVINTSAVPTNPIFTLTYDGSTTTGTALSVTCNTTSQPLFISAYTVGSSFTVKAATGTFSSNPGCFSWEMNTQ